MVGSIFTRVTVSSHKFAEKKKKKRKKAAQVTTLKGYYYSVDIPRLLLRRWLLAAIGMVYVMMCVFGNTDLIKVAWPARVDNAAG